jgi:hypothetical protein
MKNQKDTNKMSSSGNFTPLILKELIKGNLVNGNTIYNNIAKKLNDYPPTMGLCEEVHKDLASLIKKGIIIRYNLEKSSENVDSEFYNKVNKHPEHYYKRIPNE